jgi:trimeric autotransporter adhesin
MEQVIAAAWEQAAAFPIEQTAAAAM